MVTPAQSPHRVGRSRFHRPNSGPAAFSATLTDPLRGRADSAIDPDSRNWEGVGFGWGWFTSRQTGIRSDP